MGDTKGKFVDWVVLKSGEVRFGRGHAYLSNHADEIAHAGNAIIADGNITEITNESGHYKPNEENFDAAIEFFKELGIMAEDYKKFIWNYKQR